MKTRLMVFWKAQYTRKQPLLNQFFLFLISFSFIVSDWIYGAFTFTELFLSIIVLGLIICGKFKISRNQWKWVAIPIGIIGMHSVFHSIYNPAFDSRTTLIAIIKLSFYLFIVAGIYNFIRTQNLEKDFIVWNNIAAIVICILAVYIAVAVYAETHLDRNIPYEPLLTFTRLDGHLYRRDIPIVRMKSIFEEPAHLGYYLNSILMINLLNKTSYKANYVFTSVLIVTILFTLSYSAVFIMLVIVLLWLTIQVKKSKKKFRWDKNKVLLLVGILLVIFVFREFIYVTLIQRTLELIAGTESSGYERLISSWRYVNSENYLIGLGFMQTPNALWNVYAYVFTELGILNFFLYIIFILYIISMNFSMGIAFMLMNLAKGGYLSSSFWFLILLILIYTTNNYKNPLALIRKEEESEN